MGCAYFGFIDTDLVRAGMGHPSSKAMEKPMPPFVRNPVPVSAAADAIERGSSAARGRLDAQDPVLGIAVEREVARSA